MLTGIEFEQKFVLDLRKCNQIGSELSVLCLQRDHTVTGIRQFYTKNGERFRSSQMIGAPKFVKETKKSIKIGTVYSISTECETEITETEFEEGWEKNKNRRLQKSRFTMPGRYPDHHVMVDFFYTQNPQYLGISSQPSHIYAIIAEAETMLTAETKELHLEFQLPIYLEKHILKVVNDSDPDMKIFKSTNMVDLPENIDLVERAISSLYEPL